MKKSWNWWWWDISVYPSIQKEDRYLTVKGLLTLITGGIIIVPAVIFAIVIPIEISQCHQAAERQGTTGSYQFPSGCYYRLPNGLELPASEYPAKNLHVQIENQK